MDSAIIVALIVSCSAVFGAVMTYIVTKYGIVKPKNDKILTEQLTRVISPLHKLLSENIEPSNEQQQQMIRKIIMDNYTLVPPKIYNAFRNNEDERFSVLVKELFVTARSRLGYNRINYRFDPLKLSIKVLVIGSTISLACVFFVTFQLHTQLSWLKNREQYPDIAELNTFNGVILDKLGEYSDALDKYKIALAINEAIFGNEHLETANSYCNVALMYEKLDDYSLAIEYFQKAYDIYYRELGANDPNTSAVETKLHNIADK